MKVILAICVIALCMIFGQLAVLKIIQDHEVTPTNLDCIVSDACGVDHGGSPQLKSEMDMSMSIIKNAHIGGFNVVTRR